MAASVGSRVHLGQGGDLIKFPVTGGTAAQVTITHNLGRVPNAVWTTPKGANDAVATVISVSTTTIVIYLSNGADADVFVLLAGV